MAQKLIQSAHLLEIFMPCIDDEKSMVGKTYIIADAGHYSNIELGTFFYYRSRSAIRRILEDYELTAVTFVTPYTKRKKMNLSNLDAAARQSAVDYVKELIDLAAETGYSSVGVPSGDDPGENKREEAKKVLTDSMITLSEYAGKYGMRLTIEPLDRYAYKKQLIGPMLETVEWFAPIHKACPNCYIHWDSAHEALGKIDLFESIKAASPFISQAHICNAVLDENNPLFGDLHIDCGTYPEFKTEGFMTPQLGARLLKALSETTCTGDFDGITVSLETLGKPGEDLWEKERQSRLFMDECFSLMSAL